MTVYISESVSMLKLENVKMINNVNTGSLELNGYAFRKDYQDRLVKGLKQEYLIMKIFSIWVMLGTSIAGIRTITSYFFDEDFNNGLFQYMPIKMTAMGMTSVFVLAIFFAGFKMYRLSVRLTKSAEQGNFEWRIGHLTDKERVVRRRGGSRYYLYVDGERCVTLGFDMVTFKNAILGDEFIVVRFPNTSMSFVLKP